MEQVENYIVNLLDSVESEKIDIIEAYCKLKNIEKLVKDSIKQVYPDAISEASKYEKTFNHNGFNIQQKSAGAKWNYDHIKEWVDKKKELTDLQESYKASYSQRMKNLNIADNEGNVIECAKYVGGSDSLTIKKLK